MKGPASFLYDRSQEEEKAALKLIAGIFGNGLSRHRADLRAKPLRQELIHSARVAILGELVSTLAHELSQPLAAILTNAQAARRLLNEGVLEIDELNATLSDIIRDNKRAGTIVHNLRAMLTKAPPARESCCLNQLVCEGLELLHGELLGGEIEVRTTLAARLPQVEIARVELQQVLVNLLINAEHASRATPVDRRRIEIETFTESDAVKVTIRDHGHGISPKQLQDVFTPFFSTKPSGLGMGLPICRLILENHGGCIAVSNHEKGGAVFCISLRPWPG